MAIPRVLAAAFAAGLVALAPAATVAASSTPTVPNASAGGSSFVAAPIVAAPIVAVGEPPGDPTVDDPATGSPDPTQDDPATGSRAEPTASDDQTQDPLDGTDDDPATDGSTDTRSDDATTDTVAPGLPGTAPPGFSEDQYRRFVASVTVCGLDPGRVCELVYDWTGNEALAETMQWIVDVPLRILLVLAVAYVVHRLVRRTVTRYVARAHARRSGEHIDELPDPERRRREALRAATVAGTIGGAATVAIFTIAALVALAEIGVNIGPLLAGAGIVGIALGFGAQNLVRDVLAGLFVVMEDQYGVGDIIDVGRTSGTVEGITLRITKIRDVHGTLWFVPNGVVSEVGNLTQLWSRAIIDFDIDYRADHEQAGRIIKEVADRIWLDEEFPVRILDEPELWGVERLGDSSVVLRIAVKTAPAEQWKVARLLRGEVKKALDAEGIEIPFPQHTVWIHGGPDTIEHGGPDTIEHGGPDTVDTDTVDTDTVEPEASGSRDVGGTVTR